MLMLSDIVAYLIGLKTVAGTGTVAGTLVVEYSRLGLWVVSY